MRRTICYFILFLSCLTLSAQDVDSIMSKLIHYAHAASNFCRSFPQEKIYLHFDNTSYYQGDDIWFKCYLVNSNLRQADNLSKTVYVELLNPGGEIIDKKILKVNNGQCHDEFALNRLPFYSGFYEVRAYTKYMLNFGEDAAFSRLFPVFNKPAIEGNYTEKKIQKYGIGNFPQKREKMKKGKKVNLKFYPEGGNLLLNVESKVAFEATDDYGNPLDINGIVINEAKEEVSKFSVVHEGRGVFSYTPSGNNSKAIAEYNGKKYQFDMPTALTEGFILAVDNISSPDSISISVKKNKDTPDDILGLAVIGAGKLHHFRLMVMENEGSTEYKFSKSTFPLGVSQLVLFDKNGEIICDRLVFAGKTNELTIKAKTEKENYNPYELVNMEFTVTDREENPVQIPFSLSIRDAMDEVESMHNILTNLLLMSEIRGYVHNPSYYFESDDYEHRSMLDLLLMVQGWSRYSWKQMAGIEPFNLKYEREEGIEMRGQVVSFVRQKPKPNVDVSFFLSNKDDDDPVTFVELITTDSLGRFYFSLDVEGKWSTILSVAEKGKKKDYTIILDRLFSPAPRKYQYAEMHLNVLNTDNEEADTDTLNEMSKEDYDLFLIAYEDSLAQAGNTEKILHLDEVTITAKKNNREKDIYNSRVESLAYYDVNAELDDITDSGGYVGSSMNDLMISLNPGFSRLVNTDYLKYKGKLPLFVINYEQTKHTEFDYNKYKNLNPEAIKSIYVTENFATISKYADPEIPRKLLSKIHRCAVLIETYPKEELSVKAGKGVRKTRLEGYSQIKEFYAPDYSVLPLVPDYRRTLYWNPLVTPNAEGKANIRFYNNSRCRKFKISLETITPEGAIGIYR